MSNAASAPYTVAHENGRMTVTKAGTPVFAMVNANTPTWDEFKLVLMHGITVVVQAEEKGTSKAQAAQANKYNYLGGGGSTKY